MKIPHKIRIKSDVDYEVVWVDRFDKPNQIGFCDSEKKTIYLKKSMSKKEQLEIFLHELLHALEFEHQLALPHKTIYALQGPLETVFRLNGFAPRRRRSLRNKAKSPRRKTDPVRS